jgi:Ca2+-binding EF-hand superfamily protein
MEPTMVSVSDVSAVTCVTVLEMDPEACGCMSLDWFSAQMSMRNALSQSRSKFVIGYNQGFKNVLVTQEAAKLNEVIASVKKEFPEVVARLAGDLFTPWADAGDCRDLEVQGAAEYRKYATRLDMTVADFKEYLESENGKLLKDGFSLYSTFEDNFQSGCLSAAEGESSSSTPGRRRRRRKGLGCFGRNEVPHGDVIGHDNVVDGMWQIVGSLRGGNGNRYVEKDKFVAFYAKVMMPPVDGTVPGLNAFQRADSDKDGKLNRGELMHVEASNPQCIAKIIEKCQWDIDICLSTSGGSSLIGPPEHASAEARRRRKHASGGSSHIGPPEHASAKGRRRRKHERQLLGGSTNENDGCSNGCITKMQFTKACASTYSSNPSKPSVALQAAMNATKLFPQYDENGDGILESGELLKFLGSADGEAAEAKTKMWYGDDGSDSMLFRKMESAASSTTAGTVRSPVFIQTLANVAQAVPPEVSASLQMFNSADGDDDGVLNETELAAMFQTRNGETCKTALQSDQVLNSVSEYFNARMTSMQGKQGVFSSTIVSDCKSKLRIMTIPPWLATRRRQRLFNTAWSTTFIRRRAPAASSDEE